MNTNHLLLFTLVVMFGWIGIYVTKRQWLRTIPPVLFLGAALIPVSRDLRIALVAAGLVAFAYFLIGDIVREFKKP